VDKKVLSVGGQEMTLLLWDIYGDDEFQRIRTSYLRGAAGYLLVVDGTRRSTLDRALEVKKSVEEAIGQVPFVLVVNKADLVDDWDMPEDLEDQFRKEGWDVIRSSAKTGMGVEEAFLGLAAKLVAA
jgi:small GTP-binding protein